ncbi:ATP-grasp domain-containing protein [Petrimonas sulfuriphila]|jgi:glutathione synthase/RimK-type ligase-like ATP-grasp enzyme|uniref:ATP-grasp domain-containing protein n=1 Tax=Petrimonas sulfuriphila TaxID=285070 RepID=UPI003EBCB892
MERDIYLLLNYKGGFGNKYNAIPHHSGYNKKELLKLFKSRGFNINYLYPSQLDLRDKLLKGRLVLYSSMEDPDGFYKSYVEDVVYALSLCGAIVIPDYMFLKAHHNKVFMEMLRDISELPEIKNITSQHFGALEEFEKSFDHTKNAHPWVIKSAAGASSSGVRLSTNRKELYRHVKKLSYSKIPFKERSKDILRQYKFHGYTVSSVYRRKFIIQNFIEDIGNDWKILAFNEKFYAVRRPNRKNDFRASGSGKPRYLFGKESQLPDGLLDFANRIYQYFNVPMISLDIAFKNKEFYLIEMQFVAFGNSGHYYSKEYYYKKDGEWLLKENTQSIEETYTDAIVSYIERNNL